MATNPTMVSSVRPSDEQVCTIKTIRGGLSDIVESIHYAADANPNEPPAVFNTVGKGERLPAEWVRLPGLPKQQLVAYVDSDPNLSPVYRQTNVNVDLDFDSNDPHFAEILFAAARHRLDTRFAWGRDTVGVPNHVVVSVYTKDAEDLTNRLRLRKGKIKVSDAEFETEIRHTENHDKIVRLPSAWDVKDGAASVLVPMPYGTNYSNPAEALNVMRRGGKAIPATPKAIKQAKVFGELACILSNVWVEGDRNDPSLKLSGWLTRSAVACAAAEAEGSDTVYAFTTKDDIVSFFDLLDTITDANSAQKNQRRLTVNKTWQKYESNPDAKIPGEPSVIELIGEELFKVAKQLVTCGDADTFEAVLDRFVFVSALDRWYDKEQAKDGSPLKACLKEPKNLVSKLAGQYTTVGDGKIPHAPRLFASPRKRVVSDITSIPKPPGVGVVGDVIRVRRQRYGSNSFDTPVDDDYEGDTKLMLDDWRGWPTLPAATVDPAVMAEGVAMLDKLFGLLTRNNAAQIDWIKKWIAWTIQHPAEKQQVAWVCVGGMGVGKSFAGLVLMKALMGGLAGQTTAKSVASDFVVGPLRGKMIVTIDEAHFKGKNKDEVEDEIKKLVRSTYVSGTLKNHETEDHPIFARFIFLSNDHINLSRQFDRAMFYTKAEDAKFHGMNDVEFNKYTSTLKPFFDKFGAWLNNYGNVSHLISYFMGMECSRAELESMTHSSSTDPDIMYKNLSPTHQLALQILASGKSPSVNLADRTGNDMTDWAKLFEPFNLTDRAAKIMGVGEYSNKIPAAARLVQIYEEEWGAIVKVGNMYGYKYRRKTMEEVISQVTGIPFGMRLPVGESEVGEIKEETKSAVPKDGKSVIPAVPRQ